jgi:hypothetical protein
VVVGDVFDDAWHPARMQSAAMSTMGLRRVTGERR